MASPITISPEAGLATLGLAPLSVDSAHQKQGIGSDLMFAVIEQAKDQGVEALFLLGESRYYSRFGFVKSHLGNDYGATDAFMHLELMPLCLSGIQGHAKYVSAFDETGS